MSTSSESFSSELRGPIAVTPPLSPSDSSEYSPPATAIASGSNHAEPSAKRKRGRPRKSEKAKGKAPMDPAAPKRGRGRPRKEKPPTPQPEPAPHMVTYDEFHAAHWEHYHRIMMLKETIRVLELQLNVAKDMTKRHEEMFEALRDGYCVRIDYALNDIIDFLTQRFGYRRPPPPV